MILCGFARLYALK